MNQQSQWPPPPSGQPPQTQYGWTSIPNPLPPKMPLFPRHRYLILFIVTGAVIVVAIIGGVGFWFFTQLPPPSSWLESDSNSVIFIHWAADNGALSGQMQIVSGESNHGIQHLNEPFTGAYNDQDHSISLTFHPFVIFTYTLTGTISWNTLTLEGSGSDGTLSKAIFHPGSVDDFNQAVTNLEQQINQQMQNAEATTSVMQATTTVLAQNAEATTSAIQATATEQAQQQKAVSDANNALGSALSTLKNDSSTLANDTNFNDIFQSYAQDWQQMQADYRQEQMDAKGGCNNIGTVGADDGTVGADNGAIRADDGAFQAQEAPLNNDMATLQQDIKTAQDDWQQLQNAVTANTSGTPAAAFNNNDVTKVVQAAQNQITYSQTTLKNAQTEVSGYDSEATHLKQQADALLASLHC